MMADTDMFPAEPDFLDPLQQDYKVLYCQRVQVLKPRQGGKDISGRAGPIFFIIGKYRFIQITFTDTDNDYQMLTHTDNQYTN